MSTSSFLTIPASMFPDQEILVFEGKRFSYARLLERVNRLANGLSRLGVGRGDRIAILQTNSNQYVETYYAASKLAATFVPLNYRAKRAELKYMVETAGARVLLFGDRYADLALSLRSELPSVEHWIALEAGGSSRGYGLNHQDTRNTMGHEDGHPQNLGAPSYLSGYACSTELEGMLNFEELVRSSPDDEIEVEPEGDDVNVLMFTSGTSGVPKGVLLTYDDFAGFVFETVEAADGTPRGATLISAPLYHIAGLTSVMTSTFGGRRMVMARQFEPKEWLRLVQEERVTHAFLVPTMLKKLLDEPDLRTADLSSLEILSYGSAPMPLPVIRKAIELFPKKVGFINAFGQTETTSTVAMLQPDDHRLEGTPEEIERKVRRLASIGRPLPDIDLRIVDDSGQDLPPGQVGEILLRTPRLMKGYAGQSDLTEQTLVDGWIRTRDLGWIDDGGYIFLAGRKDDLIIRGGENIAPAEIETVLQAHPAVEEAAVIGCPDEQWGETVMAVLVLRSGAAVSAGEIQQFCRERLASFKKPERVVFVDALPRNPLGKVIKKELKARYAAGRG